jgi:uncharacterized metal-binding protein YceD (DUF177 family)
LQTLKTGYMARSEYEIAFVGLQPGIHNFEYTIDDKFFEAYTEQDFKQCKAKVNLTLEKNTSFMMLKFEVGGSVSSTCDRCGNDLPLTLWDEFNIIVKLVDNPAQMNEEEADPDVYYISRTDGLLSVKDWIFEFINLSIPMQKMCSETETGGSQCNQEVLDMLKKINNTESEDAPKSIWKDLDQFKNLDN